MSEQIEQWMLDKARDAGACPNRLAAYREGQPLSDVTYSDALWMAHNTDVDDHLASPLWTLTTSGGGYGSGYGHGYSYGNGYGYGDGDGDGYGYGDGYGHGYGDVDGSGVWDISTGRIA